MFITGHPATQRACPNVGRDRVVARARVKRLYGLCWFVLRRAIAHKPKVLTLGSTSGGIDAKLKFGRGAHRGRNFLSAALFSFQGEILISTVPFWPWETDAEQRQSLG
jgi:hypothetical protein